VNDGLRLTRFVIMRLREVSTEVCRPLPVTLRTGSRNQHTFAPRSGGKLTRDGVRYATPFNFLAHRWLVRPEVENIFAFCPRRNQSQHV